LKAKTYGGNEPPQITGAEVFGVRCNTRFLDAVDHWRDRQNNNLSRPAAIVRLAEIGLGNAQPGRTNRKAAPKHPSSPRRRWIGYPISLLPSKSVPDESDGYSRGRASLRECEVTTNNARRSAPGSRHAIEQSIADQRFQLYKIKRAAAG
jgi:hypothetical protein